MSNTLYCCRFFPPGPRYRSSSSSSRGLFSDVTREDFLRVYGFHHTCIYTIHIYIYVLYTCVVHGSWRTVVEVFFLFPVEIKHENPWVTFVYAAAFAPNKLDCKRSLVWRGGGVGWGAVTKIEPPAVPGSRLVWRGRNVIEAAAGHRRACVHTHTGTRIQTLTFTRLHWRTQTKTFVHVREHAQTHTHTDSLMHTRWCTKTRSHDDAQTHLYVL